MKRYLILLILAIFCLPSEGFAQYPYGPIFINAPQGMQTSGREQDAWSSMVRGTGSKRIHSYRTYRKKSKYPITAENNPFAIEITTDEITGQSIIKWKDGAMYRGQTYYGEIKGVGTMVYPDKSKYVGSWERDLPNGQGTFQTPEGITFTTMFVNGVPHGKGIIQDLDGRLYTARWVRGVLKEKSIKPLEKE